MNKKNEAYHLAESGAYYLLISLSTCRVFAPIISFVSFGIIGLIIGFIISYLCHRSVSPYMGFSIVTMKELAEESEFIYLKRWMIPRSNEKLPATAYKEIEEKATAKCKSKLKKLAVQNGYLTNYDFVNASLLETQLWKRQENNDLTEEALKCFSQSTKE